MAMRSTLTLAGRLREALDDLGLTVAEAARRTKIPASTLNKVLAGHRPRSDALEKIHLALDIDLNWLVTGKDEHVRHNRPHRHVFDRLMSLSSLRLDCAEPYAEKVARMTLPLERVLFEILKGKLRVPQKTVAALTDEVLADVMVTYEDNKLPQATALIRERLQTLTAESGLSKATGRRRTAGRRLAAGLSRKPADESSGSQ